MNLSDDYFLLFHGIHLRVEDYIEIDREVEEATFFEVSALILSLKRTNFEKHASLNNFPRLCGYLSTHPITNLQELYRFQHSIIDHLRARRSQKNLELFHESLNYLLTEELVSKSSHKKLISLFDPSCFKLEEEELPESKPVEEFHAQKQAINTALHELEEFFESKKPLIDINSYLNSQSFSIGITGVMNAGKSTMLNALMGSELLGTGVVPETANLTLIGYAQEASAKVVYWNRSEWERIESSAKEIPSMQAYVMQTKEQFKEALDTYILEASREDEINIEELRQYTSAVQGGKLSNLVKRVELGADLEFLRGGIEIVDTPGLDDVVIQREEITKEYMSRCDLMIHLMNISQSATQKDIAFIIDALLYQNISRVLIVITRVDMASQKEIEEVIAYTRSSISRQLHEVNEGEKLDFVLSGLHFIPLSAKMALLHRTGKSEEALEAGFTLEKSGIGELEAYLQQTLFSKENEKGALIIHSARNRLGRAIKAEQESIAYELTLLSKSEDELYGELELIKKNREEERARAVSIREQIDAGEEELLNYLDSQEGLLEKELIKLQGIIRQRLLDETRYTLEKENKLPHRDRYAMIIEKALKHGLIDIVRDYGFRFIKRALKSEEFLQSQYPELFNSAGQERLLGKSFEKGFVNFNNEVMLKRLSGLLLGSSLKTLPKAEQEMGHILKEEFVYIGEQIKMRVSELSRELSEGFFKRYREPLETQSNRLQENEELLQRELKSVKTDEEMRSQRSLQLHKRLKMIGMISKRCGV